MAYDVVITTEPMAREMLHVSSRISTVKDAVDTMARNVCDTEREAANRVCENVDRGFLNVIKSQVSQKKVLAMTTAASQLERMRQLSAILLRVRHQMQRDYERITSRYTKIFRKLGDMLRSRIYEIDRPAADVADTQYSIMDNRVLRTAASLPVLEEEIASASTALSTVRCKADCSKVIGGIKDLVRHGTDLESAIESISTGESVTERKTVFMPAVIISSKDIYMAAGENTDYIVSEDGPDPAMSQAVRAKLFESGDFFNWIPSDEEARKSVADCVRQRISAAGVDKRTADIMLKLLGASEWQVPEAAK